MKLLLRGLLLASLCALSSWSASSSTIAVTQTPTVSVMEGKTVNITCCWTERIERMRVKWLKNKTEIKAEVFNMKNESEGSLNQEANNCSTLTFPNITREDSGRYICKVSVEIPFLVVAEGNGTVITVLDEESTDKGTGGGLPPQVYGIITLAVVVLLLLIALVRFCILRRRQATAARVIYEVPHVDSEDAEMDKDSTSSSRGSSQWCQVPVYESFDYFERVEDKGSG